MAPQVTVIFSRHLEGGICNSDVLQAIIERASPEIIFEELSETNFHRAYFEYSLSNLEIWAIRKYLLTHFVRHIPVDTFDLPRNYNENLDSMYDQLIRLAGKHSFHFRNLQGEMISKVDQYGLPLLNSELNERLLEKRTEIIENALNALNKENLFDLARLEKEVNEKREDTILDNILRYSMENNYERGLMLIGSGHRKSIIQKVAQRCKSEKLKIRWQYF